MNVIPNFPDIAIEIRYINKISEEIATIYGRLINQYKSINHIIFSASFSKDNEEDQRDNETEVFIILIFNHNLIEIDINDIKVKSQLEHQFQIQETKESGWIFDKLNSLRTRFFKTGELNRSSYVRIPLKSSALISNKHDDKYCFLWSILVKLHACENDHRNRVSNYREVFDE